MSRYLAPEESPWSSTFVAAVTACLIRLQYTQSLQPDSTVANTGGYRPEKNG
ncbi:hypothetical protein NRB56_29440 [Nocardia sp. RB56]|uniref:Uncharacterized protein n=1 Tax=Nocardia aurantia TaxID=2585199 RepID=A0A7K0DNU4_9NOCA|nr:hypothetical protein [Nocardia aurantia]